MAQLAVKRNAKLYTVHWIQVQERIVKSFLHCHLFELQSSKSKLYVNVGVTDRNSYIKTYVKRDT